jgi:hypothetical protein
MAKKTVEQLQADLDAVVVQREALESEQEEAEKAWRKVDAPLQKKIDKLWDKYDAISDKIAALESETND